jgi:hypothetical protein
MFSELPFIHRAGNNVRKTEEQCRQMLFVDWIGEASLKKNGFPVDTEQFCIGVLQHKALKQLTTFSISYPITLSAMLQLARCFCCVVR